MIFFSFITLLTSFACKYSNLSWSMIRLSIERYDAKNMRILGHWDFKAGVTLVIFFSWIKIITNRIKLTQLYTCTLRLCLNIICEFDTRLFYCSFTRNAFRKPAFIDIRIRDKLSLILHESELVACFHE
jgi:hypothetical protein